eukprot:gene10447-11540_t
MCKKTGKETWAELDKRIGLKRTWGDARKIFSKVPAMPSGRMKNTMDQMKGKKVYLIRFVPPSTMTGPDVDISTKHEWPKCKKQRRLSAATESNSTNMNCHCIINETSVSNPKSVSIADLLKAGKLVKPPKQESLE